MSKLRQALALFAAGFAGIVNAESLDAVPLNMPVGVTEISRSVYGLHMTIFWVCVVIGILVFGVMAYSIFAHRKSRGVTPATFHESHTVEMIWTAVPFLILVVLAVPAAKTLVAMEDSSDSELTIKITGYQWKWHYDYLDHDVAFFSSLNAEHNAARQLNSPTAGDIPSMETYLKDVDNELVIPVGKKVRFLHTSDDVIHSWWVPALALKKDAIPGYINTNWAKVEEPGVYRGKCAELCGRDHGFMPVVVRAVPQEEFDAWLVEQKGGNVAAGGTDTAVDEAPATAEEAVVEEAAPAAADDKDALMAKGQTIYNNVCAGCHQVTGAGLPGAFPAITGSAVATGDKAGHIALILNGVAGSAMSSYAWMPDEDIAAVLTYQRNGLGNSVGDVVTAADVAAAR
ncbi:MAG: cytochrome c oxidase subunit II [Gammaproteobacteria bacterium]|nr:cytochrome c oxidase subunit II [Gammaproteobacteria bacterium]